VLVHLNELSFSDEFFVALDVRASRSAGRRHGSDEAGDVGALREILLGEQPKIEAWPVRLPEGSKPAAVVCGSGVVAKRCVAGPAVSLRLQTQAARFGRKALRRVTFHKKPEPLGPRRTGVFSIAFERDYGRALVI